MWSVEEIWHTDAKGAKEGNRLFLSNCVDRKGNKGWIFAICENLKDYICQDMGIIGPNCSLEAALIKSGKREDVNINVLKSDMLALHYHE